MLAPDYRKEGNRIKHKEKRTGNPEEVSHHKVGRPCGLKLGQTVKYIEGVLPFRLDHIVNIYRKRFKSM